MRPPKAAIMVQTMTCDVSLAGKSLPPPPDSAKAMAGMIGLLLDLLGDE